MNTIFWTVPLKEGVSIAHSISIRPYEIQDIEPLYAAVMESRAELRPWLPWCHESYSKADSRGWVESQVEAFRNGTEYSFVIVDASGALLGGCGLNHIDRMNRHANLGYWVRTSCTGKGVALKASQLLVEWAFEHTDFQRLEIMASVENSSSLSVARRLGALREGIVHSRLQLQGRSHDAIQFSILRKNHLRCPAPCHDSGGSINWYLLVESLRLM